MEMQQNCLYGEAQRKALIEHAWALRMDGYAWMERVH